jgi:hypothetical protein
MVIAGKQASTSVLSCTPHDLQLTTKQKINTTHQATISQTLSIHKAQARKKITNMFPQPDAETLARNPQFAILWKDLTTNKITRDGVSKSIALGKETVKVREVLKSKQIEQAKREVIRDAVRAVAFGEGEGGLVGEVSLIRVPTTRKYSRLMSHS